MHNKKGVAPEYLVIIIIALAVIILFTAFQIKTKQAAQSKIPKSICMSSVYASSGMQQLDIFAKDIRCPTQDIIIKKGTDAEQKRQLANALSDCWEEFGQGKLELFKESNIYCAVCHTIRFADKGKDLTGFSDYLFNTNMLPPRSDLKYADFLAGYSTPEAEKYAADILKNKGDDTIHTDRVYSTLFVYAKGKDSIGKLKDVLGGPDNVAIVSGGVAGTTAGIIALFVLGTNPVGWAAAGLIALGTGAIVAYNTYIAGKTEWMAITVLTEHTQYNLLKYQCNYFPVKQK